MQNYCWIIFLFVFTQLESQSIHYDRKSQGAQITQRHQIEHPTSENIHFALQRIYKKDAAALAESIDTSSAISAYNKAYIQKDNYIYGSNYFPSQKQKLWRKYFLPTDANFIELRKKDFYLSANPIIDVNAGNEWDNENLIFQNTRGFELQAIVDDKIYFYSSLFENQRRFFSYIDRQIRRNDFIVGEGFFKKYKSGVSEKISGFDYLNAIAYVGIPLSKNIHAELGHGNHFIGHGHRSLLLSDDHHNYFYLSLNTNIWKFHYTNVFAELASISSRLNTGSLQLPKKYFAAHYLSFKPTKSIEVGVFETVVFSREDHFEFQYLNPIILYRTVEQFLDSPDNVLIGLNGRALLFSSLSLYGQFVIDEFKISEFVDNVGWWGNKYGIQLGIQYLNVASIENLDLRFEYNRVRPFTYSHFIPLEDFEALSTASYTHYSQSLAHPLGSNFIEYLVQLQYPITPRLNFNTIFLFTERGANTKNINYGSDPLLINSTRFSDYDVNILGGIPEKIRQINVDVQYQVFHNVFFDAQYRYHQIAGENNTINSQYFGGGFRMNIAKHHIDY